jgi:hypothetical protein
MGFNFDGQPVQSARKSAATRGNTKKREVIGMLVLFMVRVSSGSQYILHIGELAAGTRDSFGCDRRLANSTGINRVA